jgi:hypothetical protein
MPWETWSQIAGVGGLALGLYNVVRGTREPVRLRQRELRGELRELLYAQRRVLEQAETDLVRGDPLPKECPAEIAESSAAMRKFDANLRSPSDRTLSLYKIVLSGIALGWVNVGREPSDDDRKRLIALSTKHRQFEFSSHPTAMDFLSAVRMAESTASTLIDITNRIDNGSYWNYIRRRSPPRALTRYQLWRYYRR